MNIEGRIRYRMKKIKSDYDKLSEHEFLSKYYGDDKIAVSDIEFQAILDYCECPQIRLSSEIVVSLKEMISKYLC